MVNRCVFLDRDGVINKLIPRLDGTKTAPWSMEEFELLPYVKESIDILKKLGYYIIVVTNQPDMLDGNLSEKDLTAMSDILYKLGVNYVYCSLYRTGLDYKPNNKHVEDFVNFLNLERDRTFLVGDRWKDIVCGHRSKLRTIFIGSDYITPLEFKNIQPCLIVNDIKQAVSEIERMT